MVAKSTGLSVDMTMGLYTKGLGSVTAFAAIHSDLCVAAPSDVALQAVISLLLHAFPHLTFDDDDIRGLRGFAQACSELVVEYRKRSLASMGLLSGPVVQPVPQTPAYNLELTDRDMKAAEIASMQWEAVRRARGDAQCTPRSEQIPDLDLCKLFLDATQHHGWVFQAFS